MNFTPRMEDILRELRRYKFLATAQIRRRCVPNDRPRILHCVAIPEESARLEAALATQTQNVFNEELYPELPDKAAALIRGIIADHPFPDGNKRTAMLTGLIFLTINGVDFHIPMGELEDFAVKIAVAKLDLSCVLIACGGIHTLFQVQQALTAGAQAVQIDSAVWVEPGLPARLAEGIG